MNILDFAVTDAYKVQFTASMDRDDWKPYLESVSLELQKKNAIPGFRPGAAPLLLAEREYGQTLYKPAAKNAVDDCIEKICLEKKIIPVSLPEVKIFELGTNGFSFTVCFGKYPEVESVKYRGLTAEKPVCRCKETDIDAEIDQFRSQHLAVDEVNREARMGDVVQLDFTGNHNGEKFPFDHASQFRLVLGTNVLFAGLDETLCGHGSGDKLDLTLTMPKDFHRAEIAGMTLQLHVHIQSVWERKMRELDDEFVKEFINGAETVAEYRELTRKKIQKRLDAQSEQLFNANLNAEIARNLPVQVPPSMVETVLSRYIDTLSAFAKQQGKTAEQFLAEEGKTLEDYRELARSAAKEEAAVSIAIDYVISAEHLTVASERLQRFYARYADGNKITVDEARRRVNESALIDDYLHKDAIKLVRESAVAIPVEVDALPKII